MEAEEGATSSGPPLPPPFYKHFTAQNLERLKHIQEAAAADSQGDGEATTSNILDLPPELRYLVPPEPPTDIYRSFGEIKHVSLI
jgi:mediator of RNA polymerase II transcription subunit 7